MHKFVLDEENKENIVLIFSNFVLDQIWTRMSRDC